jgi:flagella basal body P-ring formation protein FlgA
VALSAGDLAPARRAVGGSLRATYTPAAPGWVTRRVIQAGEVLRAPAVAPRPLVAAGQQVRFTVQHDGLALTLDGTAPVAGALGDTIPVRLGARRRLRGIVTGPAHVTAFDTVSDTPRTR